MIESEWSGKSLFARSLGLLRGHPVLAFPVIAADVLGLGAQEALSAIRRPMLMWILRLGQGNSVLNGSRSMFAMSPAHTSAAAFVAGASLEWGAHFMKIFLYSCALLITSGLLHKVCTGDGQPWIVLQEWKERLIRLSLLLFGGAVLTMFLGATLVTVLVKTSMWGEAGIAVGAIFLELPLAYFIARPGLMLVWRKEGLPNPSSICLARLFSTGTIVAQCLIALLVLQIFLRAIANTGWNDMEGGELFFRDGIFSVLAAIPFIVSFIAFSVLGSEDRVDETVKL